MELLSDKLLNILNEQDFCFTLEEMRVVEKSIGKLSKYEDTGLEPEAIEKLKEDLHVLDLFKQQSSDAEEAIRNAEARRDGRLIVLPCKVGDTVFWAERGVSVCEIIKCRVDEFCVDAHGPLVVLNKEDPHKYRWKAAYLEVLGYNLFLTREEAKKALEDQNGD